MPRIHRVPCFTDALLFISGLSWILLCISYMTMLLQDPITLATSCNRSAKIDNTSAIHLLPLLPDWNIFSSSKKSLFSYLEHIKELEYAYTPSPIISVIGMLESKPEEIYTKLRGFLFQYSALFQTFCVWFVYSLTSSWISTWTVMLLVSSSYFLAIQLFISFVYSTRGRTIALWIRYWTVVASQMLLEAGVLEQDDFDLMN
jgi:hypothetical protein